MVLRPLCGREEQDSGISGGGFMVSYFGNKLRSQSHSLFLIGQTVRQDIQISSLSGRSI